MNTRWSGFSSCTAFSLVASSATSYGAHEHPLVGLLLVHGLELGPELGEVELGFAEEHFALGVDRDDQRLVLAPNLLSAGLGQVDRHADLQQRCRHHEDDQQHEHDVDQRGHVDVGDRRVAPVPELAVAGADRAGSGDDAGHQTCSSS
jgi:hypothetical protein